MRLHTTNNTCAYCGRLHEFASKKNINDLQLIALSQSVFSTQENLTTQIHICRILCLSSMTEYAMM